MYLFYQPEFASSFQLTSEEAHHALKVMRLQTGDEIQVTDGKGKLARARIESVSKAACACEVIELQSTPARKFQIHLAIAPTKNSDRIEWMMEKCVELGIEKVTVLATQHTERKKINLERLHKITIAAMKQSQQVWLPSVQALSFNEILSTEAIEKFVAHVDHANTLHLKDVATQGKSYCTLIGPEGDFSQEEISQALAAGFTKVSLGPTRLRTETAGLAACHLLNLINQ